MINIYSILCHHVVSIAEYSVRPKPGFGIKNQNQGPILVSVLEPFFF
jgi:hypothetical protein